MIPTHDLSRPIRRAVDSVLEDPDAGAIVVAHNLDPADLDLPDSERIETVALSGYEGRPGACFNAGIARARSDWLGIMGSDDFYEPGALQAMRERARADGADSVLAPVYKQGKRHKSRLPTVRRSHLDVVRDGLLYRTAPLGIHRRELMQGPGMHFDDRVRSGEDIRMSFALWTTATSISFSWDDPAYVITDDADSRITRGIQPLTALGAAWETIWDEEMVISAPRRLRHALAVKIAAVHLSSALTARPHPEDWLPGDQEWLGAYVRRLRAEDPRFDRALEGPLRGALRAAEAGAEPGTEEHRRVLAPEGSRSRARDLWEGIRERDSALRWRWKDIEYEARQRLRRRTTTQGES